MPGGTRFIDRRPGRAAALALAALPFALLLVAYAIGSDARLAANPADKLLPSFATLGESVVRLASEPSRRSGEILLWADTLGSLRRLGLGVGIATCLGLATGLLTGALPLVRAGLSPLLTVVSLVPMLALLPILFIVLGLGEVSKVALIVLGITPFIARDVQRRTEEIPHEQVVKALTLGAGTPAVLLRVLLPQVVPKLLDAVRLSLGTAWLFLIAAEAIASTDGLGYRIFLVRRYLAMDVILPYVAWITLLAFVLDRGLARLRRAWFPWEGGARATTRGGGT